MITDLGTRQVDDLRLVDQNSTWINCFDWMRKDKEFPIKSLDQIRLSREELAAIQVKNVLKHYLDVTEAVMKTTSQKISEILPLHSGIIVVLSNN